MTRFRRAVRDRSSRSSPWCTWAPLPGTPLHDEGRGVEGIIADARADLRALQAAGFDAVMFGNENDRPYELQVDVASTATMALRHRSAAGRDQRAVRRERAVGSAAPRWPSQRPRARASCARSSPALYASDMGLWVPDAAAATRYARRHRGGGRGEALQHLSRVRPLARCAAACPTGRVLRSSPPCRTPSWSRARSPASPRP